MENIKNLNITGYEELNRLRKGYMNHNHSKKTWFLDNARFISPSVVICAISLCGIESKIDTTFFAEHPLTSIGVTAAIVGTGFLTYKLMNNYYKKSYIKFLENEYDVDTSISDEDLNKVLCKEYAE